MCHRNRPGVFVRVAKLLPWIRENTGVTVKVHNLQAAVLIKAKEVASLFAVTYSSTYFYTYTIGLGEIFKVKIKTRTVGIR